MNRFILDTTSGLKISLFGRKLRRIESAPLSVWKYDFSAGSDVLPVGQRNIIIWKIFIIRYVERGKVDRCSLFLFSAPISRSVLPRSVPNIRPHLSNSIDGMHGCQRPISCLWRQEAGAWVDKESRESSVTGCARDGKVAETTEPPRSPLFPQKFLIFLAVIGLVGSSVHSGYFLLKKKLYNKKIEDQAPGISYIGSSRVLSPISINRVRSFMASEIQRPRTRTN